MLNLNKLLPTARNLVARFTVLLTGLVAAGLAQPEAHSATVTFRWDYGASGAAGFMLYCGTSSRNYSSRVDVGNTETFAITTLKEGATSYCAVTAYDPAKAESTYSNEIAIWVPSDTPTPTPTPTPPPPDPSTSSADLNSDGVVDMLDVRIFWRRVSRNDPRADLNDDGIANSLDFGLFKRLLDESAAAQ